MKLVIKSFVNRVVGASLFGRRLSVDARGSAPVQELRPGTGQKQLQGRVPSVLLSQVLDTVSEGALVTDAAHEILYSNAAFSAITGYAREEVLGRNCQLLQGPGSDSTTIAALRATLARGDIYKGEILNYRKDGTPFWNALTVSPLRDAAGAISGFVRVQRDVTAQKALQERVDLLALHDQLTGLPNRAALDQHLSMRLADPRRKGGGSAVGILNLDDFKFVNDTFGQEAGDVLLAEFANRLKGRLRGPDFLARLDGDEFAVVIEDLDPESSEEQLGSILGHLHGCMETDFVLGPARSIAVRMSLGLTLCKSDEAGGTPILRRAQTALYHLKTRKVGRNRWWQSDTALTAVPDGPRPAPAAAGSGEAWPGAGLSASTAQAYRQRLFTGGLCLFFQPVADLRTGEVRFLEALARLSLKDGTVLPPGAFLPLLTDEEVDWLFHTGLEQALHQLAVWDAQGHSLSVSLNLPPSVLLNPDCAQWVASALDRHNIAPHRLVVELLENRAADDAAQKQTFTELLTLGVGMALDDLGVGHSSLRRLTALSFSTVKIDQRLVAQLRTSPIPTLAFLATMIQMGRDMGWRVVAEGLEDAGITEAASILGIPYGQGYHLARPMPAENVPAWIADFNLPPRDGPVRTFPGALAYHWQFARFDSPHPGPLDTCPLTDFLSGELSAGTAMKWHQQQHHSAAAHAGPSAELLHWLTSKTADDHAASNGGVPGPSRLRQPRR